MELETTKRGCVPCGECHGVGERYYADRFADGGLDGPYPCAACDEHGQVVGACPRCGAEGVSVIYAVEAAEAEYHGCEACVCVPPSPTPVGGESDYRRGWEDCERVWAHRHATQTRRMRDEIEKLRMRLHALTGEVVA